MNTEFKRRSSNFLVVACSLIDNSACETDHSCPSVYMFWSLLVGVLTIAMLKLNSGDCHC